MSSDRLTRRLMAIERHLETVTSEAFTDDQLIAAFEKGEFTKEHLDALFTIIHEQFKTSVLLYAFIRRLDKEHGVTGSIPIDYIDILSAVVGLHPTPDVDPSRVGIVRGFEERDDAEFALHKKIPPVITARGYLCGKLVRAHSLDGLIEEAAHWWSHPADVTIRAVDEAEAERLFDLTDPLRIAFFNRPFVQLAREDITLLDIAGHRWTASGHAGQEGGTRLQ
jgi:hypothetical protein